jgi:hypothetical protein
MGKLESLWELSIALPNKKNIRKEKNIYNHHFFNALIVIPWLFHPIGTPVNFEVLNHSHSN